MTRVPETKCLECGHIVNAVGNASAGEPTPPEPGDAIACIECGAVATIDASGALRPFTEEEAHALTSDPEWWAQIHSMVRRIHLLKHSVN